MSSVYLFILFVYYVKFANSELIIPNNNSDQLLCIKNILLSMSLQNKTTMIVYSTVIDQYDEDVLKFIGNFTKQVIIQQLPNKITNYIRSIIIIAVSVDEISNFVAKWSNSTSFNTDCKYLVIYSGPAGDIDQILTILWHVRAYKAIIHDKDGNIHAPKKILSQNCKQITTELLSKCENLNITLVHDVFLRNYSFTNCTFDVLVPNGIAPFGIRDINNNIRVRGMEPEILNIIAKQMNFNLHYVEHNYTTYGLIGNGINCCMFAAFYRREADIMLGLLFVTELAWKYFDPSSPTIYTTASLFVPKAQRQSPWLDITRIFHPVTWLSFFGAFNALVLFNILFKILTRSDQHFTIKKDVCDSFFEMLAIVVTEGIRLPTSSVQRIVILSWVLFCFVFSSSYESTFISFLVNPVYEKQINTIQDIIKSGIPVYGNVASRYPFDKGGDPAAKVMLKQWVVIGLDETVIRLLEISEYRNGAVAASRDRVRYEMKNNRKFFNKDHSPALYEMKPYMRYYLWALMQRGLPIRQGVNWHLLTMHETGLIDHI